MYTTVLKLLILISSTGTIIGCYEQLIKKEEKCAEHIFAYSFFIIALAFAMQQSYVIAVYLWVCAVWNYADYRKKM